jgi:uncharacterized protein (DUF2336 family)
VLARPCIQFSVNYVTPGHLGGAALDKQEEANGSRCARKLKHILTQTEATNDTCYPCAHHISSATRQTTRLGVRLHFHHTPQWWLAVPPASLLAVLRADRSSFCMLTMLLPDMIPVVTAVMSMRTDHEYVRLGAEAQIGERVGAEWSADVVPCLHGYCF